jgi:hypothetical protein
MLSGLCMSIHEGCGRATLKRTHPPLVARREVPLHIGAAATLNEAVRRSSNARSSK